MSYDVRFKDFVPPNRRRKPKGRRESEVKAGVLAYLDTRTDMFGWRQNTSASTLPSGLFVRSNMRGVADWIGVQALPYAGAVLGRFVAVECKREIGGELSRDQELFKANVLAHGGLYLEVRSVDETQAGLGPIRAHIVKLRRERVIHR